MTRADAARALGADLAQLEAALAGRAPDAQHAHGPRTPRMPVPPGTRPWPPSARPTVLTCAACRTGSCSTCATPIPSRPLGRRGTSGTSCGRSAPPPRTPAWPACAPPPTPASPTSGATATRQPRSDNLPPATRSCRMPTGNARPCSPRSWPTGPTGTPPPAPSGTSQWPLTPNCAAATPASTTRRCARPNPSPPPAPSSPSSPRPGGEAR